MTNELYIVQARPETIHHGRQALRLHEYRLTQKGTVLAAGKAVGNQIVSGTARILASPADGHRLQQGDILVTDITSPDWNTVMRKASVIVTNKGGRTSHAAIVAREPGAVGRGGHAQRHRSHPGRAAHHRVLRRGRHGPSVRGRPSLAGN
ncbi:PEP-utilizing enzyme [Hymenobacter humi]|uniref:PEP-utilizing enzyme n=1 Tax=Hymenobacter humi TaxID=1411620 RepID=A0ABW2UFS2_9BACT